MRNARLRRSQQRRTLACARRSRRDATSSGRTDSSLSMSTPVTRAKMANTSAVPRPKARGQARGQGTPAARGHPGTQQPPGASRKSSALREGGCRAPSRRSRALRGSLVELAIAPAPASPDGGRQLAVDGLQDSSRAPRRWPDSRRRRRCALGVQHQGPKLALQLRCPAPLSSASSIRCGSPESSVQPSAERPPAASIVTTALSADDREPERDRRRGRRLADAARARGGHDHLLARQPRASARARRPRHGHLSERSKWRAGVGHPSNTHRTAPLR